MLLLILVAYCVPNEHQLNLAECQEPVSPLFLLIYYLKKMTQHCPVIVNQTAHSIVVFQERVGVLYNKQVLLPGEAVSMTRQQGGLVVPYHIHVVVGDERQLPTLRQSMQSMVKVTAIPTAFVVAALATAASAGTLAGPAAALAPLVSGMVVKGVVIDAAAIAAGTVVASRVAAVSELLVKKYPEKFMHRTSRLRAGKRFVVVRGGVEEPLTVTSIKEREFKQLGITTFKAPIRKEKEKTHYYDDRLMAE